MLNAGDMNAAPPVPVRIGSQLHGGRGGDEPLAINHPDQFMQADRAVAVAAARRPIAIRHSDKAC
jgi:hypothetical protein